MTIIASKDMANSINDSDKSSTNNHLSSMLKSIFEKNLNSSLPIIKPLDVKKIAIACEEPETNFNKIEFLRNSIATGSYEINYQAIALKLYK